MINPIAAWFKKIKQEKRKKRLRRAGVAMCPQCGGDAWYEGPSGGSSSNCACANCGTEYGISFGCQIDREIVRDRDVYCNIYGILLTNIKTETLKRRGLSWPDYSF